MIIIAAMPRGIYHAPDIVRISYGRAAVAGWGNRLIVPVSRARWQHYPYLQNIHISLETGHYLCWEAVAEHDPLPPVPREKKFFYPD